MAVRETASVSFSDGTFAIRPLRPEDARSVYEAIQESAVELNIWMPDLSPALTIDEISWWIEACARWWEEGSAYNCAIVDQANEELLGGCGLTYINQSHSFANLAYWVRSSSTGRGAATSATRLLAKFAFEELGLQRAEIVVAVGNPASARVAEKAGALLEGTLRNRIRLHDKTHDAFMYSLIPEATGSAEC